MSANRLRILFLLLPVAATALVPLARPAGTVAQPPAEKQTAKENRPSAEGVAIFEKEVLPILKANCFKCHGDGKVKGGLSLASREGVLTGGERGPAVSLEKPEESRLLQAINYHDKLKMPPPGKLAQKEIDTLTRWVKAGVPWPGGTQRDAGHCQGPRLLGLPPGQAARDSRGQGQGLGAQPH
jgi:mono/diheme cytochrome c family protein